MIRLARLRKVDVWHVNWINYWPNAPFEYTSQLPESLSTLCQLSWCASDSDSPMSSFFSLLFFFLSPSPGQDSLLQPVSCHFNNQNSTLAEVHSNMRRVTLNFERSMMQLIFLKLIKLLYLNIYEGSLCILIQWKMTRVLCVLIQVLTPNCFHVDTKASVIPAPSSVNYVRFADAP